MRFNDNRLIRIYKAYCLYIVIQKTVKRSALCDNVCFHSYNDILTHCVYTITLFFTFISECDKRGLNMECDIVCKPV